MIYKLDVPYQKKDKAKSFGARWDSAEHTWYYEGDELPGGLARWYFPRPEAPGTASGNASGAASGKAPERASGNAPGTASVETPDEALIMTSGEVSQVPVDIPYPEAGATARRDDVANDGPEYLTVSQVNTMIAAQFRATDSFRRILVKGEVTNFSGSNKGHYYFSIKDEDAVLPCILWKSTAATALRFKLEKGKFVGLIGRLEYYGGQGTSRLIVSSIKDLGDGEMGLTFLRMKARLEAEGLFSPEYKKPIPKHPRRIGILTSARGAVIRDICAEAKKRDPYVELVLYNTAVQGRSAADTIVKGIRYMDARGFDTLIVGRGGGSDEDLGPYNEEAVVRAVFEAVTPVISAVGHETHVTLIDLAADLRAWTPTAAAEAALPDVMSEVRRLGILRRTLGSNIGHILSRRTLLLEKQVSRLEGSRPDRILKDKKERTQRSLETLIRSMRDILRFEKDRLEHGSAALEGLMAESLSGRIQRLEQGSALLSRNMDDLLSGRMNRLQVLIAYLHGASPTARLTGGFGYVTLGEQPLTSVSAADPGDRLKVRLHDGSIEALVDGVFPDSDDVQSHEASDHEE